MRTENVSWEAILDVEIMSVRLSYMELDGAGTHSGFSPQCTQRIPLNIPITTGRLHPETPTDIQILLTVVFAWEGACIHTRKS